MQLAHEGNTDLAFDTDVLRDKGKRFGEIADELRKMAQDLDKCLTELKDDGWTTPAGTAFHKMVQVNWEQNIAKYADLLDTLDKILDEAATKYETLVSSHIERTQV